MISQILFSTLLATAIFFLAFNIELKTVGIASNLSALLIVIGGTLAATLIAYPWRRLLGSVRLLQRAFLPSDEIEWTRNTLVAMAREYQKRGIRLLEEMGETLPRGYLKSAVEFMGYHYSREEIEHLLQKEANLLYSRYEAADKILCSMARLAPALGLTGTIVSLIRTFGHIKDPGSLVGYMGIALLSTFYGVVLANLCFTPLSNRLREFMEQEAVRIDLVQEGILDIYDRENPLSMEYKLASLSAPAISGAKKIPPAPRPNLVVMTPPRMQASGVSS